MTAIEKSTELDGLINDYLDALAAMEKWQTIKEELAEQVIARIDVGNSYEVAPGAGLRVAPPNRVWSEKQAKLVLLENQWQQILELKPTREAAIRHLPGALVELCKVPQSRPRIVRLDQSR